MPLTAKRRRELLAASHPLRPVMTIAADNVSAAAVAHLRTALAAHELVKVRLAAQSTAECGTLAADVAARVPCEVVARVGRVVVFYRPEAGE
jgi:RNA-binding protein